MKHIVRLLCSLGLIFVFMPKMQAVLSVEKGYKLTEAPRRILSKLNPHLSYLKNRPSYRELDTRLYQVKGELFASIMEQKQAYVYASRLKPFLDLQRLTKKEDRVTRMTIDKYKAQGLPPKPKLSNPRLQGWLAVHKFEETSAEGKREERTMVFYLNPQLNRVLDANEWYGFDVHAVLHSFDMIAEGDNLGRSSEEDKGRKVFRNVVNLDKLARFTAEGGDVQNYLQKHIRYPEILYPEIAIEFGHQGRVILKFVVNEDGSISDIEVVRGVEQSLDFEAMRILLTMPAWEPAEAQREKVASIVILPVVFRLI